MVCFLVAGTTEQTTEEKGSPMRVQQMVPSWVIISRPLRRPDRPRSKQARAQSTSAAWKREVATAHNNPKAEQQGITAPKNRGNGASRGRHVRKQRR